MQTMLNWLSTKEHTPNPDLGYLVIRPTGKRFRVLAAYCILGKTVRGGNPYVAWYAYPGKTILKDVEYFADVTFMVEK